MLKETVEAALRNMVAKTSEFTRVNVDTTVQEKNIRFPTDAWTLDRALAYDMAVRRMMFPFISSRLPWCGSVALCPLP